jgi:hypothetical protein
MGHILEQLPHESIRCNYQNINGLKLGQHNDRWANHMVNKKEKHIKINGFAKCNTNLQYTDVGVRLNKASHKEFNNYLYSTARINQGNTHQRGHQPGWAIQICTNHLTG